VTDSASSPQYQSRGETAQVVPLEFAKIYSAQVTYVWSCLRRLGVPERDLEDKIHDVFVTLYRRLSDLDPTRPIRPYLAGIAVRVASDHRRKAYQKREQVLGDVEAIDETRDPEAMVQGKEARDLVLAALEQLDLDRRTVFVLHELEGHPVPEVAEILEVPLNTCYSRLRLAREEFTTVIRRLERGGR
jgi:RNA polymerase sigma-70 factor, ECF subfamily